MRKTHLWWLFIILFLTGCQAVPVVETPFDYTYQTVGDGVYITGYVGKIPKNITLPARLDNQPVIGISKDAFRLAAVETVQIPSSIRVIEEGAFYAAKLKNITFHKDSLLEEIDDYAFAYTLLNEIRIPDSVERFGNYAFTHSTLDEVLFGSNSALTSIGDYAFYNNVLLKFMEIPEGVTTIGDYAFYAAFKMEFIQLPSTLVELGTDVFGYNNLLMRIEVSENNLFYRDVDGVLLTKDGSGLLLYPSNHTDRHYTLPSSVVYIEDNAFMGSRIESISFPSDTNLRTIGKGAFKQTRLKGNVHLPNGLKVIQDEAFHTDEIKSIFVPETVTFIGEDAFDKFNISNIFLAFKEGSINKTNALTFVLGNVFFEATYGETTSFSYIVFPTEVYVYEYIKEPVTYVVHIPATLEGLPVRRIMSDAFMNTNITHIHIGQNVEVIHSRAFLNAEQLVEVTFDAGSKIKSINGFSFYGTDSLLDLVLPEGITTLQFGAFMSTGLTSIYIPKTVTNIGMNVFMDNPTLTIYTAYSAKPSLWDAGFNPDNLPIIYNYTP